MYFKDWREREGWEGGRVGGKEVLDWKFLDLRKVGDGRMRGFVGGVGVLNSGFVGSTSLRAESRRAVLARKKVDIRMVLSPEKSSSVEEPKKESKLISRTPEWAALKKHATEDIPLTNIKELLEDEERNNEMLVDYDDIYLDFTRQRVCHIRSCQDC